MIDHAIHTMALTKSYPDFTLQNISFHVPQGSILGLIGENGAGKTTLLNCILHLIEKESGTISIFGTENDSLCPADKERIGTVPDEINYPTILTPEQLNHIFKKIYSQWDEKKYHSLLEKFSLPLKKSIKDMSLGMKKKLSIAVALSHHAELLILDEPTTGLDPVIREEILDILLDFVQDERHSVLLSTHITSDLEKIADYIAFLHNGALLFQKTKDTLIYEYGIIKCGKEIFDAIEKSEMISYRKKDYQWEILVADKTEMQKKYPKAIIDSATIDDIMLFYTKGETK